MKYTVPNMLQERLCKLFQRCPLEKIKVAYKVLNEILLYQVKVYIINMNGYFMFILILSPFYPFKTDYESFTHSSFFIILDADTSQPTEFKLCS